MQPILNPKQIKEFDKKIIQITLSPFKNNDFVHLQNKLAHIKLTPKPLVSYGSTDLNEQHKPGILHLVRNTVQD